MTEIMLQIYFKIFWLQYVTFLHVFFDFSCFNHKGSCKNDTFLVSGNSDFKTIKQKNVTELPPTTVVKLFSKKRFMTDTEERREATGRSTFIYTSRPKESIKIKGRFTFVEKFLVVN